MHVVRRASLFVVVVAVGCQSPTKPPSSANISSLENTDAFCADGLDNDNDGNIDCNDLDCMQTASVTVCRSGTEDTPAKCRDGQDNDNDGRVDCLDPECEAWCDEANDEACSDGVDNDDDSFADCEDFSCKYGCGVTVCDAGPREDTLEECTDGVDNDGDGYVDCDDRGCQDCATPCQVGLGENTVVMCSDGLDNDDDGAIDCRDTECFRFTELTNCDTHDENTAEKCSDGVDNDNDPFIDCADRDCGGLGDCTEDTVAKCTDGISNDGDPFIDCADFDCHRVVDCTSTGETEDTDEACSDGQSNDGDSYVDCADFDCKFSCSVTVCGPSEKSTEQCSDGIDNDGDNKVDCTDIDCLRCAPACGGGTGGTPENTLERCTDTLDNDGDGGVDCQDPGCVGVNPACSTGETNCTDGIDNDNDPWADCADRDCRNDPACAENTNAKCSDGLDNDGDGFVDCNDFDCTNGDVTACPGSRENTDATCSDGIDNDNDQKIDCLDTGCSNNPALTVCPAPIATTIVAIQNEANEGHAAVAVTGTQKKRISLAGVTVSSPILTRDDGYKFFYLQEAFPPADTKFRGIEVYVGNSVVPPALTPGQTVNFVGFYTEFKGVSQLTYGKVEVVGSGTVGATALTTQDLLPTNLAEAYEGVLVTLGAVKITQLNVESRQGEDAAALDFAVREASAPSNLAPLTVSRMFTPRTPALNEIFGYLIGHVTYTYSQYRLAPRVPADFGPGNATPNDDDNDGLTNAQEALLGTNPNLADTDGDGENDLAEVGDVSIPKDSDCDGLIDAIESSIADTDGDGVFDEEDTDETDGPNADPDNDGVVNSLDPNDDDDDVCDPGIASPLAGDCTQLADNCPGTPNNDQADSDGDGVGDACDPDIDGDEICNRGVCFVVAGQCNLLDDNCDAEFNPEQTDLDVDGQGDACDPDDDNDGICEVGQVAPGQCSLPGGHGDNCEGLANADQADNDNDGLGDACDADDDNDTVCDPGVQAGTQGCVWVNGEDDNCPLTWNQDQADTNTNGVGDACESDATLPVEGDIIFNEVLYDPESDNTATQAIEGDANNDGVRDSYADEFVELVNVSGEPRTLQGCRIKVRSDVKHNFSGAADPSVYQLAVKQGAVVFGGGTPQGAFGTARVFVANVASLTLANNGANTSLECPTGPDAEFRVVASWTWASPAQSSNPNQSYTRQTQGNGTSDMVLHDTLATGVKFSPGACPGGAPLATCL